MSRKPNVKCSVCSKEFYKRPSEIKVSKSGNVFCSKECYGKSSRKEKKCSICGNTFIGNKKHCSMKCSNISRKGIKYFTGRRKDKVNSSTLLKKRLIEDRGDCCENCGYNNVNVLQTHHIDENNKNNEMDNLKLLCPNCHYTIHYGDSRIEGYSSGSRG